MTDLSSREDAGPELRLPPAPTVTRVYRDQGNGVIARCAARDLHKWFMSRLPKLGEKDQRVASPRAVAQLQWYRAGDALAVRTREDISLELTETDGLSLIHERPDEVPTPGSTLTVMVNRRHSPRIEVDPEARALLESLGLEGEIGRPRSRRVPVPDEKLEEWAKTFLGRHLGEAVELTMVRRAPDVILSKRFSKRERVPAAELTARVADDCVPGSLIHTQLTDRFATGIGGGKNYGLGMIRLAQ